MDTRTTSPARLRRKHVVRLVGLVSGGLLLLVLLSQLSFQQLTAVAQRAQPSWIVVGLLIGWIATCARAARFCQFFDVSGEWLRVYGVFATTRGVNFLLPFRSGELFLMTMLKKHGLTPSIAETTPVWITLRASDVGSLAILSAFCVNVIAANDALSQASRILFATVIGCVILLASVGVWMRCRTVNDSTAWFAGRMNSLRAGFGHLRGIRRIVAACILAVVVWSAMAIVTIVVQMAFDSPLSIGRCFVVGVSVLIVSTLPIHGPLGIGTDDASWAGFMVLAGVDTSEAIALALCVRLVLIGSLLLEAAMGVTALWFCGFAPHASQTKQENV